MEQGGGVKRAREGAGESKLQLCPCSAAAKPIYQKPQALCTGQLVWRGHKQTSQEKRGGGGLRG